MRSQFPPGARPTDDTAHARFVAARLAETGISGTESLADVVDDHARTRPDVVAFAEGSNRLTWREYRDVSDRLGAALAAAGAEAGSRVGVMMPDGPGIHCAYLAAEKAGVTVVGIGPRAGVAEIRHLLDVTGATHLVTGRAHRDRAVSVILDLQLEGASIEHLELDDELVLRSGGSPVALGRGGSWSRARQLGIGDLFLVNSTSGTTGLPKCVSHTQNRWRYFHELAVGAAGLTSDDVFFGAIPAPFGFGIWTAHVSPTLLGSTAVLVDRFGPERVLAAIERERVTILACVSTQFIMMLNSPEFDRFDLSSLRAMFTGGESVPYDRAAEFETRTGARVLQFYGSNETGALSYTTLRDSEDRRLRTCGHVIERMRVRVLDNDGQEVALGEPGQPACAGPANSLGYFADVRANAELITDDGWMLTGDIAVVDDGGYLRIVGRQSDFIIRGGKNVSAAAVEEQVSTHPAVKLAAAVGMPDSVFGERVCAYVELHDDAALDLEELRTFLRDAGCSPETMPERLVVVDAIPKSSGGKIAKGELRTDIRRRLERSFEETAS